MVVELDAVSFAGEREVFGVFRSRPEDEESALREEELEDEDDELEDEDDELEDCSKLCSPSLVRSSYIAPREVFLSGWAAAAKVPESTIGTAIFLLGRFAGLESRLLTAETSLTSREEGL